MWTFLMIMGHKAFIILYSFDWMQPSLGATYRGPCIICVFLLSPQNKIFYPNTFSAHTRQGLLLSFLPLCFWPGIRVSSIGMMVAKTLKTKLARSSGVCFLYISYFFIAVTNTWQEIITGKRYPYLLTVWGDCVREPRTNEVQNWRLMWL